jgi:Fe-S-cluster-containing dehydrogenase component
MEKLFLVDLDRCFGCSACEVACKQEKNLPSGLRPIRITEVGPRRINEKVYLDFVPTLCCQCADAQCMEVCPSKAFFRSSNGAIKIDEDKCTGCGLCVMACPYGFMDLNPDTSKPAKCDFCSNLVERGLDPSCVSHCPANALKLRPESDLSALISSKHCLRIGKLVYVSQAWVLSSPDLQSQEGKL